ncbi:MAG: cytochrome P450 [Actinoallomurus sp.]
MSVAALPGPLPRARTFRLYRNVPRLLRDPMREVEKIGSSAAGQLTRINFGVFHVYLATHPDHVQHVLLDNAANFRRDGTYWRPLHRLFGESIMSEGAEWKLSRRTLQPVLTRRYVHSMAGQMAEAINERVDDLTEAAETGRPVSAMDEISAIVSHTVIRVFFGNKISAEDTARLTPAFEMLVKAIAFRFLLPFLPPSIPVPGDRALKRAVAMFDEVLYPLIREQRWRGDDARDFFSVLCQGHEADGGQVTDRWIRDNLFAMFATGTETTVGALTWLWPLLDAHPQVSWRLCEEIDRVVGSGPVRAEHLADLDYTRQVVQELLRLYPAGWVFPRRAVEPAQLGGVTIKAGESILVSPFLTHRLEAFWERPLEFDPDRFAPADADPGGHRYAYVPFGAGPHKCIGQYVFNVEAELIIASILSRFRPTSCTAVSPTPRVGATLRPRENVELILRPV